MSKLTDKFKRSAFFVRTPDESQRVQKLLFALGFVWSNHRSGNQRNVERIRYAGVGQRGGYIFVDHYCRMNFGDTSCYPSHGNTYTLFTENDLKVAVAQHKAEKKVARKQSRKNKRLRAAGWTVWKGGECPFTGRVEGQIMLRSGGLSSSNAVLSYGWRWTHDGGVGDIIAYKLAKPVVVTQTEMVDDIVKSAGGVEVDSPVVTKEEMIIELQTPVFGKITSADIATSTVTKEKLIVNTLSGMGNKLGTVNIEDYLGPLPVLTDTNPKKQFGDKSIPLNLWPALASAYGALGLYNGKLKYGMSNFNATPVEASIYIAGAKRHLEAWAEGEEFDPADGAPNLGGVLANIAILLEARAAGTLIDDRKLGTGYLKEREALKSIVASLQVLHAEKTPRHYTIKDTPK